MKLLFFLAKIIFGTISSVYLAFFVHFDLHAYSEFARELSPFFDIIARIFATASAAATMYAIFIKKKRNKKDEGE